MVIEAMQVHDGYSWWECPVRDHYMLRVDLKSMGLLGA
jgi:hypothetical protein